MPSTSSASQIQEHPIDIKQKHDELIAEIISRISLGNYMFLFLLTDIVNLHQNAQWTLPDSRKIQEILRNNIIECDDRIKQDCPNAIMMRAIIHMNGWGDDDKKDYARAIELYDQAIALGYAPAMHERARMYQNGWGGDGKKDYARAIELYDQAIALGYAPAMHERAIELASTLGYAPAIRAKELLEQAIVLGYAPAMYTLSRMYRSFVRDCRDDGSRAIELLEQAIVLGYAPAMYARACNLINWHINKEMDYSYSSVIELLDQAIALDHEPSMNERAYLHLMGLGGERNYSKAARLYRRGSPLPIKYQEEIKDVDTVFGYHFFMRQSDFDKAADLIITNPVASAEFFQYDLQEFFKNPKKQFKSIESVISTLAIKRQSVKTINKILIHIFVALDEEEKTQTGCLKHLAKLKRTLLSHINFTKVGNEEFNPLALIIIDTWNALGDENTERAAKYLSSMIRHKTPEDFLACLKGNASHEIVKMGTVILLKAIYGEKYGLSLPAAPSPGHLAILAVQYTYQITPDSFIALNNNIIQSAPIISDDPSPERSVVSSSSSSEANLSGLTETEGFFSKRHSNTLSNRVNNAGPFEPSVF